MFVSGKIETIAQMSENWDGYGAVPIHHLTAVNADKLLSALRSLGVDPDVTPNPNGTISFEWEWKSGIAHVEIGKTRGVAYTKQD